jgi:DNA-binding NarL/FixJ family response regulator
VTRQVPMELAGLPDIHSCCRCGKDFTGKPKQRVCHGCRRPKRGPRAPRPKGVLPPRLQQIATLVAEGYPNKEIAWRLHLDVGTVKVYVSKILERLRLNNRAQLAAWETRRAIAIEPKAA